jgi:hypothetical protein
MENPRERLFPYHLNADEVEKEFRIWKCLEQQLKQERKTKSKREKSLEDNRKELWDSLKEQRIKKKSNPGKGKRKTKHNPDWGKKKDKSHKNALRKRLETINKRRNQEQIRGKERNLSKNSNSKKNHNATKYELNWEKKRIKENNETLKRKLQHNLKEQRHHKISNNKKEKLDAHNLNWEEKRTRQIQRALAKKNELNKKEYNLEKEREKLHNDALQQRIQVLKEERKYMDKWESERVKSAFY